MKNIVLFLIISCTVAACRTVHKIPEMDYEIIPYKGNEILVFESNMGNKDTVFLQGIQRFISPVNQWSFPLRNAEYFRIISKRSDPNIRNGRNRYLDSLKFITLYNDGETKIEINFSAKNAWLYGSEVYTKNEFSKLKDTIMTIGQRQYTDVLIITPKWKITETNNDVNTERSNTITKLYWSKKNGVIRYDKLHEEFWELRNKYIPASPK
jgi:hypothetical protein